MERKISLGQVLSISVTLIIAIFTGWVTINNKVTDADRRITNLELQQEKMQNQLEQIMIRFETKLDKQSDEIIQVRLLLENKENRR